ncbi:MAG: hypothetical protein RLW68_09500 [Devosia marina]|uniref:aldo/keto reductase n=1 Tax=Devosia marina TaxID=2683198 RepID=UPI0032EDBF17
MASYGWGTDNIDRIGFAVDRQGFDCVEIGLNLFQPNARLVQRTGEWNLPSLILSPLAMQLLGDGYQAGQSAAPGDVCRENLEWIPFFADGLARPGYASRLAAICEPLTSDRRSVAQGALAWHLAQSGNLLPIPGFNTEAQRRDNQHTGPVYGALLGKVVRKAVLSRWRSRVRAPSLTPPFP